ncbi:MULTISPECIES: DUF6134 family protein [Chitinophaga]|uniref:DUF6134 family protein n=1 Tax=Chitinophaga TaxID=79328 RepID=UPI000DB95620|nr:DUF6134 family protein [Chitinophaga ginsengisegetis]MDR6570333.1 hypothetical protein [Chitinophaga ginsengisegetis]MDR6650067.1 hypothetical protein [Chitinophaga ginsengisegetis]MDR6656292.1 hypothetical protein [Chitinophaga ginsengisegetis]
MNSLFRVLFITFTVAVLFLQAKAQTNTFEVRIANHAVGTIEANRKLAGNAKSIIIKTRIQIMLSKINSDIANEYSNNVLTTAKVSRVSGKSGEDKQTTIHRNGKEYTIIVNGAKSVIDTEIEECVADLYFMEPRQLSRVFSETLGRFLPVKSLGGGVYELILPEGKKNVFKYENGILKQVEVNHTLGKAFFVKIS